MWSFRHNQYFFCREMAGVFDIDIHDPDMGNNVDLDGDLESDDDVIEVEVIMVWFFDKLYPSIYYLITYSKTN